MASHPGTGSTNILGKPTFSPMLYFSRSSPSFPTARIASGLRTASREVSITLQIYYPDMVFNSFLNFLKIATQIDNLSGSRSFIGSFIAVSLTALQHNAKYWCYKCYPNYYGSKQLTTTHFQLPVLLYLSPTRLSRVCLSLALSYTDSGQQRSPALSWTNSSNAESSHPQQGMSSSGKVGTHLLCCLELVQKVSR